MAPDATFWVSSNCALQALVLWSYQRRVGTVAHQFRLSWQSIDLNVPAITVSGTIRPLVHLCPNLKVIDMVHDEWADQDDLEDGVLDIAEDMALLQQEYPHILFKNFGKVIKQGDLV